MDENYFERQAYFSLLCGLHSLNNVLGSQVYTKQQLNEICYQLSDDFINPHKHIFGGDYDANVLLLALQNQQCTTRWHDRRIPFLIKEQRQDEQNQLELVGYIINKFQGQGILHKIFRFSPRHWIAVRRQAEKYRFLDSSRDQFEEFGKADTEKRINEMLNENLEAEQRTEVIQVYRTK